MDDKQQKLLKKINRRSRFTQFLAWLALFFTAVGIAAGYKNWLRIHDKAKAGLKGLSEIREEMPSFARKDRLDGLEQLFDSELKNSKIHLDKAMLELRNIQDSTQHIAESVYSQVESITQQQSGNGNSFHAVHDWSHAEVRFLLQTAVQRFRLHHDKSGAIEGFKQADALLLERASLEYLPVRKQISLDLAAVKQHPEPDIEQLSAKIDAILERMRPLEKVIEPQGKAVEFLSVEKPETIVVEGSRPSQEQPLTPSAKPKDTLVNRVKKTINEAVIIRKYDKPIQTEIDSDARERFYQLASLRLETLRLMLYQRDDSGFHRQIGRIRALLTHYYPQAEQTELLPVLDEIDKVNLVPGLPDVSGSLKLLDQMTNKSATGQS